MLLDTTSQNASSDSTSKSELLRCRVDTGIETMDDKVLRRLDCLSKKQLLEAIRVITNGLSEDAPAITSLKSYLDGIEPAPGSSRKLVSSIPSSETGDTTAVSDNQARNETETGFDISKWAFAFILQAFVCLTSIPCDRYRTRQVAFQVQYDGSKYLGFASQDLAETVENHLFNALIKLKLIEDRKVRCCGATSSYHPTQRLSIPSLISNTDLQVQSLRTHGQGRERAGSGRQPVRAQRRPEGPARRAAAAAGAPPGQGGDPCS